MPKEYIPTVEEGFREGRRRGTSTRSRSSTWSSTLHFGKYHDVDSSQDAFYLCAAGRLPRRPEQAGITLLEPIMKVVVVSPEDSTRARSPATSTAAAASSRRRARTRASLRSMAKMPLANLFGYTSDLRGATSGTARFSMEFSHYAPVKEELADLPEPTKK